PPTRPTSTLFPYTTLFRSLSAGHQGNRQKCFVSVFRQSLKRFETGVRRGIGRQRHDGFVQRDPSGDAFAHLQADLPDLGGVRQLDRKSTRLNSSHVSSSYA